MCTWVSPEWCMTKCGIENAAVMEDDLEGRDSAVFSDYLTLMRQRTILIKLIKVAADQQPVSKSCCQARKRLRHVAFDRQSALSYREKKCRIRG